MRVDAKVATKTLPRTFGGGKPTRTMRDADIPAPDNMKSPAAQGGEVRPVEIGEKRTAVCGEMCAIQDTGVVGERAGETAMQDADIPAVDHIKSPAAQGAKSHALERGKTRAVKRMKSRPVMWRAVAVCLAVLMVLPLLAACQRKTTFQRDDDGNGFTNAKTRVHYRLLDFAYEPAKLGALVGTCREKAEGRDREFHEIPELPLSLYVADDEGAVYYAGEEPPNAALWEVSAILLCLDGAVSVERGRLTHESQADSIAAISALWFEGDSDAMLPLTAAQTARRVKLMCDAYPNLFYCFSYYRYESGEAYFYDRLSRRTVLVPSDLVSVLEQAERSTS